MLKYYMTRSPQVAATMPGNHLISRRQWQTWPEIDTIRQQLDQVFAELSRDSRLPALAHRVPAIELSHTADTVVLTAELPGIAVADIDIEVTPDTISLKGTDRETDRASHYPLYRSERRTGSFHRVIQLPIAVDHTGATAEFDQGILTLTLPKLRATPPTAVKVTIGGKPTDPTAVIAAISDTDDPGVESIAPTRAEAPPENTEPTPSDPWQ